MRVHCFQILLSCLLLVPLLAALPALKADDPADKEIVLKECLVIKSVGQSGRSVLHNDPIEAELVAGRWKPPAAGDAVQVPDGPKRTWESARANSGALQHEALRG